jgi:hypothetical protein
MKNLFVKLLTAVLIIAVVPQSTHFDALQTIVLAAVVFAALVVFKNKTTGNVHTNGVQVELWVKYIIQRFWKDNGFLKFASNDDQYVLQGKVVHIPQPGTAPVVVKNRSSLPATAIKRTDTDITYTLDEYTTDPSILPDADKVELSYDKMNDLYGDHANTISQTVADDLLIKWAPSTTLAVQQFTTGGTNGDTVAASGSMTGTRKGFHADDLKKAMITMNVQNIPKDGRKALIDDNMYDYFLDSLNTNQMAAYQQTADLKNGIVGRLYGFDIITRSAVLQYSSANVVNVLGASTAVDDNLASLVWHPLAIARAMGEVKFFTDPNNPLYYGDLYSALMRMGGRIRRADGLGIVAIIQGA